MKRTNGRPSGFDYVRLFLATEVLVWHTVLMTYGWEFQNFILDKSIFRALPSLIVPMFFALSGFLVATSLDRMRNLADFMSLRLLRILPGLWVVVLVAALLIGPLVSDYGTAQYFSDPALYHYFLNMLGDVQLVLPGVFTHNPFPSVANGQLWTIPLELACYAMLAVLAALSIYRRPVWFLGLVLLVQAAFAARAIFVPVIWGSVPPSVLFLCFLSGSLMNIYRARIPFRRDLAALCAVLAFGIVYVKGGSYFIALPAAYLTVYLGLLNPKKTWVVRSGDYSYGIYLYAFLAQQLVAAHVTTWLGNLVYSLPLAFAFAFLSWHLVEKRALRLRNHIKKSTRWPLALLARWRLSPARDER